uniref:Dymeclin n=1 Tax=Parascaris equorum TaxID=6256 RepID=A0A914S166_PAREQ
MIFWWFYAYSCYKDICSSSRSMELTKALLTNYLQRNTPYVTKREKEPESIVLGLAASVWSVMQLAAGYDETNGYDEDANLIPPASLGSLSVLLLLNLACHQNADSNKANLYKETLSAFQNAREVSSVNNSSTRVFRLDYSALYDRLCATVIPVLRVLHDGSPSGSLNLSSNSHHVYLSLIVILILSEDDFFCKIVHETMIKNTSWYQAERPVGEVSLGGLIILVFVRTIQLNTLKTRDRYLHTNCLAALANMSSSFKQLSSTVCQKLIGLLERRIQDRILFTKRHAKLIEHMRISAEYDLEHEKQTHNYIYS